MKQVEKYPLSPVEQELSFISWCRKNDIRKLLFDGDDTLWETKPRFNIQMEKCYDLLATVDIMPRENWKSEIISINDSLFEAHGVNPQRWNLLVEELALRYPLKPLVINQAKDIFSKIYTTPLPFVKGTEEALKFFRKIGKPDINIVTHAGKEWTWKKYHWLKLDRFLDWDNVYLVDENGHKTKESWLGGMDYFKVEPVNCLGAGDSPRADINPLCELGVEHCFLIRNSFDLWSLHQQSVDETKVRSIQSINDLRYLGAEIIFRK
ncbi:MAG: hypothetical protein US68_C0010G0021 [Candidatus Shapirobacteria bacterium GW2011_GWE1_38_10]|uniref:Uncharacterized protein n=1 Tax=Candidatus Shapirobacteria bacterium GW2011_GWE1_38_10 TaxID=1618488 RepID=A0A0G0I3H3_9BACT|nr:MAG: hypothetical protein US46_C0008G0044 [Candidatus Shapirobacteria bacterium GW2011_GWF2_37_20]KKQ49888.1 MAG: hypothetical protein US68_C0010G0021 [Candidatus Shapirobacteria bacterium GW2011_GWE1_38_10]KKQ64186.1 MAG: hypothetical protein US85_C0012G0017 [Candidatus Shapirobacteria bacterium GW2011_GWF1_38_23]HBP50732.1 hypothetical protein [Candidatus Shapirobacteria bacterium]